MTSELGDGSLPAGYKSKRCKICRSYSHSRSPLPAGIFPSFDPLLPWADGRKEKPRGCVCRICYNVTILAVVVVVVVAIKHANQTL